MSLFTLPFPLPPSGQAHNRPVSIDLQQIVNDLNTNIAATVASGVTNTLAYYTSATAIGNLTAIIASRALASNTNGLPVASSTTDTELSYVHGVTSAIQTQFNTITALPFVTIGNTGSLSAERALTGTVNQITVTDNGANSTVVLSTPQDINTISSPTFANLTVSTHLTLNSATAKAFAYIDASNILSSTANPANGELLIGSTGAIPTKSTLTQGTGITITNGAGSITIANAGVTSLAGTTNQVNVSASTGSITLSTPQNIDIGATVTFSTITGTHITGTATPATAGAFRLANTDVISWRNNANGANISLSKDTSDVLKWNSAALVNTVNGTTDQVNVSVSGNSVTLSTPQSINTTSSPTFANLTISTQFTYSGATAKSFAYYDANKVLTSTGAPANGEILIGSTNNVPVKATITGTTNQITVSNGAGSITLSTPQDIATGSSPTFGGLTLNGALGMASHKITSLTNGSASSDAAAYGQLKVLQTVTATTTTNFTTSSNTFQSTNLAASITPTSSSSRVIILINSQIKNPAMATAGYYITLDRSGTNLGTSNGLGIFQSSTGTIGIQLPFTMFFDDSPATTSSRTYTVKIRNDDNSTSMGFGLNGLTQTMTLLEVQ